MKNRSSRLQRFRVAVPSKPKRSNTDAVGIDKSPLKRFGTFLSSEQSFKKNLNEESESLVGSDLEAKSKQKKEGLANQIDEMRPIKGEKTSTSSID